MFYNKFIICLYMFPALCDHHQEVKIVLYCIWYHYTCRWPSREKSSLNLCTGQHLQVWWYHMLYNAIFTSWWWAQKCSKHVEAYNKSYYKTRICALSWLITKVTLDSPVKRAFWNDRKKNRLKKQIRYINPYRTNVENRVSS